MKIKTMAFREVYNLFVDVWELYRKYGARRLDDAECEAMTREADAINEKYQLSIRPCERYVGKCDQGSVKRCTNEDKRYGGIDHGKINT